jgi:hypothetical protein
MARTDVDRTGGDPTPEEVAAAMAALEEVWPRAVIGPDLEEPARWRFSGRWWSKPMPLRRERPW